MRELYSLLVEPIKIWGTSADGILEIFGNIERNWITLVFTFNKKEHVAPVIVRLYDGFNCYEYLCSITRNDSMKVNSDLFICDFLISQKFYVHSVEPLVEYRRENDENFGSCYSDE